MRSCSPIPPTARRCSERRHRLHLDYVAPESIQFDRRRALPLITRKCVDLRVMIRGKAALVAANHGWAMWSFVGYLKDTHNGQSSPRFFEFRGRSSLGRNKTLRGFRSLVSDVIIEFVNSTEPPKLEQRLCGLPD